MGTMATRIIALREGKKLSQAGLGAEIGVSRVSVTKWESGATENIKPKNLLGLCRLFSISLEELVEGKRSGIRTSHDVPKANPEKVASIGKNRRPLVQQLCDLAENIHDDGLRDLIGQGKQLVRSHPLSPKAKRVK